MCKERIDRFVDDPTSLVKDPFFALQNVSLALANVVLFAYNDWDEFKEKASMLCDAIAEKIKDDPEGAYVKTVEFITEALLSYGAGKVGVCTLGPIGKLLGEIFKAGEMASVPMLAATSEKVCEITAPIRLITNTTSSLLNTSRSHNRHFLHKVFSFAKLDPEFKKSYIPNQGIASKITSFIRNYYHKRRTKHSGSRIIKPKNAEKIWNEWAPQKYDEIRKLENDIKQIAQNTRMPIHKVKRIKKHLFFENHDIGGKMVRFDPDPDIVDSWERLIKGTFSQKDLQLLEHEYFESKFEKLFKTSYRKAHEAAIKSGRFW